MKKNRLAWLACTVLALASGMSNVVSAQDMNQPPPPIYSQEELDQMLAPVALYPDALLAQILMAATYPLEVVQAERFVESRPDLQGDALARAVSPMPWDPSVKSLVQFPSVLAMMNDKLDWMQQLGNAFLSQQGNVMDTVQNLRMRAQMAGNLQSNSQQRILQQDQFIEIESVNPQVIYVPYYNPTVIYGGWWWPDRPPVYWVPPPRYRPPHYSVGIGVGIFFGAGVGIIHSVFNDARPDWRQHRVMINNVRINNNVTNNGRSNSGNNRPTVWQHDNRYQQRSADPRLGNGPGQGPNRGQARPEAAAPSTPASGPRPNGGPPRDREDRGNRQQPAMGTPGPAPQARPAGPAPQLPPNAQGPERNQRDNAANEQRLNQQRQNEQRQNEQRANGQRQQEQRQQQDQQRQQQEQQRRQQQDVQRQQHQQEAQIRAARPPEAPRPAPEPRPQQQAQPRPQPQPAEHARPERSEPQGGGGDRRERDR